MIGREGGIEGRRFQVDILPLVAVALGQEFIFGLRRGLEGFGFGPVLVDLVAIAFTINDGFSPGAGARLWWETKFLSEL